MPAGSVDCKGATQAQLDLGYTVASNTIYATMPTSGVFKLCVGDQPNPLDSHFTFVAGLASSLEGEVSGCPPPSPLPLSPPPSPLLSFSISSPPSRARQTCTFLRLHCSQPTPPRCTFCTAVGDGDTVAFLHAGDETCGGATQAMATDAGGVSSRQQVKLLSVAIYKMRRRPEHTNARRAFQTRCRSDCASISGW